MENSKKIDLFKQYKTEYKATQKPQLVECGPATYLTISGQSAPGSDQYTDKIGALYSMAFTIKMTRKRDAKGDYVISKLEAQYWDKNGEIELEKVKKDNWLWNLMIRTPENVQKTDLENAVAALTSKGKGRFTQEVSLGSLEEGLCVQMLHTGPYEDEKESLDQMSAFMHEQGLAPNGKHHEIYLSDPRRIPPERLKTILRQPVSPIK